ncbi:MAG TPA: hypothetical protein VFV31_09845 [Chitinophagaceae bacterium]|nr:hypothetical protein [Chitinophagaceae bacterium]
MKTFKIIAAGVSGLIVAGSVMISCTKNVQEATALKDDFSNNAIVQLYVATVNASRNYVYVDAQALNGSSLSSGSVFPGTGYGFNVGTGFRGFTVRDTLSTTTQVPLTFAQNFQGGKSYTVFTYDTITNPKQKTVETLIDVPTDTTARIRFGYFTYSPNDVPAVDIFSVKRKANIFSNVMLTDVTDFVPIASGITDTLFVRLAGSGVNLQNFRPATPTVPAGFVDISAIITPTIRRSYTLVFRGGFRASATNNATVRTLSVFINR